MKLHLIPQPKKAELLGHVSFLPGAIADGSPFEAAAATYAEFREKLFGALPENATPVTLSLSEGLPRGGYSLDSRMSGIALAAADPEGASNAVMTLLQLMAGSGTGEIPAVRIEDAPDSSYRGLLIDLARIWHPIDLVLRYVDLCAFYKVSTLHLHFTDTQSFTLPSDAFPLLPSEGRHYTKEEIGLLNDYAKKRGVTLMPELESPGHCNQFIRAYPEIFGSGTIIPFTAEAFAALDTLIGEIASLFPDSPRIHIGGDEANIAEWLSDEKSLAYAAECGIPADGDARLSSERILAFFVRKLSDMVLARGRTPVAWEGFAKEVNDLVPRSTEIFSWENYYQTTYDLIDAGYTLINGTWNPNYIVAPDTFWSVRECFDWNIFNFRPIHKDSPLKGISFTVPPYEKMIGGQLLSWGDYGADCADPAAHLESEWRLVADRLPATAENVWNTEKRVVFAEFEESHGILTAAVEKLR